MEIIILPYMAISFSIAWAIFSPLAEIEGLHQWTFARIETGDLLAIFVPLSSLLAFANWATSAFEIPMLGLTLIVASIGVFTLAGLFAGLFLLAKMSYRPVVKRMAMIGVVIPLGSLLTLAWFALPIIAIAESVLYAIPATIAVVPITMMLRSLCEWVCRDATLAL